MLTHKCASNNGRTSFSAGPPVHRQFVPDGAEKSRTTCLLAPVLPPRAMTRLEIRAMVINQLVRLSPMMVLW